VAADEAADTRDARILNLRLGDVASVLHRRHGAEFENAKRLLIKAVAALREQRRTVAVQTNEGRDQNDDIEQPLDDHLDQIERVAAEAQTGDGSDLVDPRVDEAIEHALGAQ